MHNFHELAVKEIIRETDQAVSLVLEIPAELQSAFTFKAGQYITFKSNHNDEEIRRSYSLCSTPKSRDLKVSVKEVNGGVFSAYVNNKLEVGDILKVFPPEGRFAFTPQEDARHFYAAFAAGSGITPIMGIIKTALSEEKNSKFVLVYGNKSPDETIFFKELLKLQMEYPDRLFIEFVYSRAKEEKSFFGRIEKSTVNFILKNRFKGHKFQDVFLCGPEPMIDSVSETLKENGLTEEHIHFELFSSEEEGELHSDLSGKTQLTVMLDDEETSFEMDQKSTVLDAVLEKDLDAPYSCQGGICSSCVARITEGKAEMAKNQILMDDEIAEGLILTCQAHPTTSKLKIDYDDV